MQILVILIALVIYFLPTIVAKAKGHDNTAAIFWINLLLGATVIGWLGAMVWAVKN
jgi:uncharacterized membrane protein YqaE (UPF0057 family)